MKTSGMKTSGMKTSGIINRQSMLERAAHDRPTPAPTLERVLAAGAELGLTAEQARIRYAGQYYSEFVALCEYPDSVLLSHDEQYFIDTVTDEEATAIVAVFVARNNGGEA